MRYDGDDDCAWVFYYPLDRVDQLASESENECVRKAAAAAVEGSGGDQKRNNPRSAHFDYLFGFGFDFGSDFDSPFGFDSSFGSDFDSASDFRFGFDSDAHRQFYFHQVHFGNRYDPRAARC